MITFSDTGTYSINKKYIFEPPIFPKDKIENLYRRTKEYEKKFLAKEIFDTEDWEFFGGVAGYYLVCYFNGI